MRLLRLTSANFRCLADQAFTPGPGLNVVRGANAQGKTSLLEAMLYLTTSKSHRTNTEQDLPRHGADGFHLKAETARLDRRIVLEANWWKGQKRFKVNGVFQPRISEILGKVHVVFFAPEDVELVRGSAAVRRRFLDMELSQLSPGYLRALQNYRLILRQRNELLKSDKPDGAQLAAWDEQLVTEGTVLMRERAAFIAQLAPAAVGAHSQVAPGESLAVAYRPDVGVAEELAKAVEEARPADLRQRTTTRGPHRDDVAITLKARDARHFGSQGQQRTAALAVKFAEVRLVADRTGECPILLLDDVLSELDAQRSERLLKALPRDIQCFLTTTDLTRGGPLHGGHVSEWEMKGGALEPI